MTVKYSGTFGYLLFLVHPPGEALLPRQDIFQLGRMKVRPMLKGKIMFFSLTTFTIVHVLISLVAIASGFVVLGAMLNGRHWSGWTAFFLVTTVMTSVTGFLFPIHGLTPGLVVGVLSMIVLGFALYGLYVKHLAGSWRSAYVVNSVVALYFNFFVLIAQSFQKIPLLKALAPTQSEPPFAIAQVVALVAFIVLGSLALKKFRNAAPQSVTEPQVVAAIS